MKYPYKHKQDCKELNSLTLIKIDCGECSWYNNGVIETGSIPNLERFLSFIFKRK